MRLTFIMMLNMFYVNIFKQFKILEILEHLVCLFSQLIIQSIVYENPYQIIFLPGKSQEFNNKTLYGSYL